MTWLTTALQQKPLPLLVVALVAASLFIIRLTAPPNLLDQDQERPAAYVLDVVKNGNWICQRDLSGDITSKPPVYTWVCALIAVACGRVSLFALYLPGALAAFGVAWLILAIGRSHFGPRAALLGALASMLTTAGLKQFGLARTDGVFAFTVTAAALLAWRAWTLGRGWTWFWLMAAAATLTKGPLGVLLAGGGLLAVLREKKSGEPLPPKGSHLPGISLFFLITAGWFLLAYWQAGPPLIAKMLGRELVQHAVARKHAPGSLFYQPPLYYLARAAPWSLAAYYGLWRIWKYPSAGANERRFERFLFCWLLAGLFIFSMAPHQRADHLWPIMPAGALIAGRELSRLSARVRPAIFNWSLAGVIVATVSGFAIYYFGPGARAPLIKQTVALKKLASEIERRGGKEFPLWHVDDPMTLQFYLNSLRPQISFEQAAELLRGAQPAFVAVNDLAKLESLRKAEDPSLYAVLPVLGDSNRCPTYIVGNRPGLSHEDVTIK